MSFPDTIPPETKVIMEEITSAIRNGGTATIEELWAAWTEITARILKLETERDELRSEVEALKAEAERYAGWTRWKDGLWKISHPESGPSAEWIGEAP